MYMSVHVYVLFHCRVILDRDRVNIVLTPVISSYSYYFYCCVCVHVCLLRANAVVLVVLISACIIMFFSLSLYFLLVSLLYALLLSFFFVFFFSFFSCCLICLCVCVSQNEDQHNVFDVYLFFFLLVWFALIFFLSLYTYLFKIHTQQSIQTNRKIRISVIVRFLSLLGKIEVY